MIVLKTKRYLKKLGKNIDQVLEKKVKRIFNFYSVCTIRAAGRKAEKVVLSFLRTGLSNYNNCQIAEYFRYFHQGASKFQRICVDVICTRYSKVGCLETLWDKLLYRI